MLLISIPKLRNSFKIVQARFKLLEQLGYWKWEEGLVSVCVRSAAVCLRVGTGKDAVYVTAHVRSSSERRASVARFLLEGGIEEKFACGCLMWAGRRVAPKIFKETSN